MTLVRSRKARILEKAGLRYVAGWLKDEAAKSVSEEIEATKAAVEKALENDRA